MLCCGMQKYIRRTNPYIRILLVGWITVLDQVPDMNLLDWLPDFLDGLFNMLADDNKEIRQVNTGTEACGEKRIGAKGGHVLERV